MITSASIIFEGIFVFSILGLYLAFKFGYKKSVLEAHRLRLFDFRSKLYSLVQQGKIDPDHPAYRHVENHVNELNRFSHRTTTIHLLFSYLVRKAGWYTPKNYSHYLDGIKSIPRVDELEEGVVETLVHIKRESFNEVIKFLSRYSPVWNIVKGLAWLYFKVRHSYHQTIAHFEASFISKDYDLVEYNRKRELKLANMK